MTAFAKRPDWMDDETIMPPYPILRCPHCKALFDDFSIHICKVKKLEMTDEKWKELIAKAEQVNNAMSETEKAGHNYEQRRSLVRGLCPSNRDYAEWCRVVDLMLPPTNEQEPE